MAKQINLTRCYFTGCKSPIAWRVTNLWGKCETYCVCDAHKPGAGLRGKSPKPLFGESRQWYRVEPTQPAE
jgi:hypothetical protein